MIDREGVVSKCRGVKRYGAQLAGPAKAMFEYLNEVIQLVGTTLSYDSDGLGTWVPWTGSFSPPRTGVPMTSLESNGNFYVTTSGGVFCTDALTVSPKRAGMPRGLDTQLSTTGTGGSWFLPDSQVGVKVVWMRKDLNENEKRGTPSTQEIATSPIFMTLAWAQAAGVCTVTHVAHGYTTGDVILVSGSSDVATVIDGEKVITVTGANTYTFPCLNVGANGTIDAGKSLDLILTFTVPSDIVLGDEYEIYRSPLSPSEDDPPSDEHRLVIRAKVTAAEIAAGLVTLTDDVPMESRKEPLYTNQNDGEGSSQGNDRPPFCTVMAVFKGHTFYGDYLTEHKLALQLTGDIESLVDNTSSVTFTSGATNLVYTFSTAENQAANKFQRHTIAGEGALSVAIRKTAKSLVKIINRDPTNTLFYAHYVSAAFQDSPGKILLVKRTVNTAAISAKVNNSTTGAAWSPVLPTTGATVVSTSSGLQHALLRSKAQQPEAVPSLNIQKVGSQNKAILGLHQLPHALLVYKEDGVFILSGESDGAGGFSFVVDELDSTVRILGRRNIGILNGAGVVFTSQGLLRVSPSGTSIISRAVEIDLLKISEFPQFETLSFLTTYESERKVTLWVPEDNTSEVANIGWTWNYITDTWTQREKAVSCGLVMSQEDVLYLGHAEDPYILKERKGRLDTFEDFQDEDYDVTVSAVAAAVLADGTPTTSVTVAFAEEIVDGWWFEQGDSGGLVVSVTSPSVGVYDLLLDAELVALVPGAAVISRPIDMIVEWAPEDLGSSAALKQFSIAHLYLENATGTHRLAFRSDLEDEWEYCDDFVLASGVGWGDAEWGDSAWGGVDAAGTGLLRTWVPRAHQKARNLSVLFENHFCRQNPCILQVSLDVRVLSSRAERKGSGVTS